MASRANAGRSVAFGGVLAALAVVIMCLGGLIPVATFICPMLCMGLLAAVLALFGSRIAWAWYLATALLSVLLGPDKEAASVFLFIGYYPILKPYFEKSRFSVVWKLLLFNAAIIAMYLLLIYLFGMNEIGQEFAEAGKVMTAVLLILGNVTFFLMDKVLDRLLKKK